jgi:hypothetical protein
MLQACTGTVTGKLVTGMITLGKAECMHASIACLLLYEDYVCQWVSLRNAMKAKAKQLRLLRSLILGLQQIRIEIGASSSPQVKTPHTLFPRRGRGGGGAKTNRREENGTSGAPSTEERRRSQRPIGSQGL